MVNVALRFISGKYKGGEYVLADNKETIVGRSSEIDLVLMEEMVSRKHAKMWFEDGKLNIKDLGSTNGTFVNGEKIVQTTVGEGDRVLIGTSIMKVIESNTSGRKTETSAGPVKDHRPKGGGTSKTTMHNTESSHSMTGTIREIPLPDLIQLLSTSKKSGTLIIKRNGVSAKIHLDKGKLVYASIDDSPGLNPLKAVFKILSFSDGTFELHKPEPKMFPETINLPTEHILMEGLTQLDELRNMEDTLPPMDAKLNIIRPLVSNLIDLTDEELEVFQLVFNCETLQEVIDRSPNSNKTVAGLIMSLISKEYISRV